jgi:hypothetical protein
MLVVTCTHGVGCSLYAPPLHTEEVEQDEDCREYGDVQYVPPRCRQGAQGGIHPPAPGGKYERVTVEYASGEVRVHVVYKSLLAHLLEELNPVES